MANNVYVYKYEDLYDKAMYKKKSLMNFINTLGYLRGVTPMEEVDQKPLQRLIDVQ